MRFLHPAPERDTRDLLRAAANLLPRGRPLPDPIALAAPAPPRRPLGCAFVGGDRLLLQYPLSAVVIARATGAIAAIHDLPAGLRLVAVGGERASWLGGDRFGVLDLRTGAWAEDRAPGLAYAAVIEVRESAYLVNADEGFVARLAEVPDYIHRSVSSADNRDVWVTDKEGSGGVYEVATGALAWDAERDDPEGEDAPVLMSDGRLGDEGDIEPDDEGGAPLPPWALDPASAVARAARGRFRLCDAGVVSTGGEATFRVGFSVAAARFDEAGASLLLASQAALTVVKVGKRPRVERRFLLDPLASHVADPRAPRPASLEASPKRG